MNSERLTDLEALLKDKWPLVEQWRYHNNNIEFGMPGIGDKIHWFPYIQAPEPIARYVHSYIKTMKKEDMKDKEENYKMPKNGEKLQDSQNNLEVAEKT